MAETTPSMAQVRADFDLIDRIADAGWDHNSHSYAPNNVAKDLAGGGPQKGTG